MLFLFNTFLGIGEAFIRLLLVIDAKIYWVFSQLYNLYLDLANARLFNNNVFDIIIGNVYAIITVIALFIVAFMLLKSMVNVDDVSKGTKAIKDLIIRIVKATFLICLSPFLFDLLYDVQGSILGYGSIQKILLGSFGAEYGDIVEVPVVISKTDSDGNVIYEDGEPVPLYIHEKCLKNPNSKDTECTTSNWCENNDNQGCVEYVIYQKINLTTEQLKMRGNTMAFYVLNGFMHPANGFDAKSVVVDASKEFGVNTGIGWTIGGVLLGGLVGVAVGIIGIASGGVGFAAAVGAIAASAKIGAIIGGVGGMAGHAIAEAVTASEYTWSNAMSAILAGDFDKIVPFANAITAGEMNYVPIISTIGAGFFAYMMFSFCLDLGVRAAKLLFYETMAPVSFLLSIIPGKEDLTNNWFKAVFTTWIEVFVRIFIISITVLLISNLEYDALNSFSPVASAILILGIITFAKQVPKLLGDITGIKSDGIKLGIKEKLMDGGLGTMLKAGAAVGSAVGGLAAGRRIGAAYRAAKHGWKEGNFKGIGTEANRRREYKEALENGATRRQLAWNRVRNAFGYDTTADSKERKIKSGAVDIVNNSGNDIQYIDSYGRTQTIKSGGNAQIDTVTAEALKAKKTRNIGAMAAANDKMRDLDSKIKWASSQKSWKSAMDDEADKKFNDGKYEHDISYMDSNGKVYKEKVNGKRLSELSEQGMKFLDSNGKTITEKKVRDAVRKSFSTAELSSNAPNLIKNKTESFYNTLQNEGGFSYRSYVYDENGRQVYKDGKAVETSGTFTSKIDENNNRVIIHEDVNEKGEKTTITYKDIGNGMLAGIDEKGNKIKEMSVYDLSDLFDQASKSTSGVLEAEKQSIAEGSEFIAARNENDAIDALLKQRDDIVAQNLQSEAQRGREAAKKYTANHK